VKNIDKWKKEKIYDLLSSCKSRGVYSGHEGGGKKLALFLKFGEENIPRTEKKINCKKSNFTSKCFSITTATLVRK